MKKKQFFISQKTKIAMAAVVLVSVTVSAVVFYMQREMERTTLVEQYKNAETLLQCVRVSVENQYRSIVLHKQTMLNNKKEELRSVINVATLSIESFYNMTKKGLLTEEDAKKAAINELRKVRYQNKTGYLWISDTDSPYPHIIMHPIMSELQGKVLTREKLKDIFRADKDDYKAMVDMATRKDGGFIKYYYLKPSSKDLSELQPKLSYVKLFRPWGWIIGTGLYIKEIDERIDSRIDQVLKELNETFGNVKIGTSGYAFVFTGKRRMIFHPIYSDTEVATLKNPVTGKRILDDLMKAAKTTGKLEYTWDKPGFKGDFRFKKVALITYFQPLDWYIGCSFYLDEVKAPAHDLRQKALLFSLFFLALAFILSFFMAHYLTRPMQKLITVFAKGAEGDYSVRLDASRNDELGLLAEYFNKFMEEIENSHSRLQASETKFRSLFEKSADARLTIENDRFVEVNEALIKMVGCKNKNEIINCHPSELSPEFQPDGRISEEKANEIMRIAKERGTYLFNWMHKRCNGELFLVEVELTAIPFKNRELMHCRWRDLTQQKKTERQLMQAQKLEAVGTLAAGLAHDFNNVLSGIVGPVSIIKFKLNRGDITTDEINGYLDSIEIATERAAAHVQQLLALSRNHEISTAPVDINTSLRHVVKIAQTSFDKSIIFKTRCYSKPAITMADPSQIEQVILNCCINSAHSMTIMRGRNEAWGGILSISVAKNRSSMINIMPDKKKSGTYWCITIKDSGTGIKNEDISKIFDPFFTRKEQEKGSGLGLTMVYNIVNQHDGFINVDSVPDKGTRFRIYFPVIQDKIFKKIDNPDQYINNFKGHGLILIVDDEEMIRRTCKEAIESFGYTVITAADGKEGVTLFREYSDKIRLVILDMAMPVMSGRDAYIKIRKTDKDVKIIISSGFGQDHRVKETMDMGASAFIQKPYNIAKLMGTISNVLNIK